ncbi:hypothetical protein LLG46_15015 [bacterium]|nr:hypothetical protein [bacterium]
MRTALSAFIILLYFVSGAYAAGKVSLNVSDMPIKDVAFQIEQQAGISIVVDPKAQASISVSISDVDVNQALDVITKLDKLAWKKLQFAKPADTTIKLEQLKSAILSLSALPMVGLSVEDPASKTTSICAKDLTKSPDTSGLQLPEGYTWTTVYVILNPEADAAQAAKVESDVDRISKAEMKNTVDMANMTPEQRQQVYASEMSAYMTLSPEDRQSLLADRMRAMFNMSSQDSEQFRQDMHSVMQSLQQSGEAPDWGRGRNPN